MHEDIAPSDEATAVWLSSEGYMVGLSSGAVVPMHADRVSVDASLEGRSRFVVRDGIKQVITLLSSTQSLGHGLAVDTVQ